MRNKKKILALLGLTLGLCSCSNTTSQSDSSVTEETEPVVSSVEAEPEEASSINKETLVVVFSATGTTKSVAEKIAVLTDADFHEIVPTEIYSEADLDYNDENSRSSRERKDPGCRPEIAGESISLEGYTTIYIGYPIWWGDIPKIMISFVESYDFEGITMIPFCTSHSSGVGKSAEHLAEYAGSGNWKEGTRFAGSVTDEELQTWIEGFQ